MWVGGGSARRGQDYREYCQIVYRPPPGTVHQTTGGPPARIGNTCCYEWMPRSAAGRLPWWTPTTHLMRTGAWKRRQIGRLLAGRRRPCRASGGLWAVYVGYLPTSDPLCKCYETWHGGSCRVPNHSDRCWSSPVNQFRRVATPKLSSFHRQGPSCLLHCGGLGLQYLH